MLWFSEHRALCLRAPCSVFQNTVLCVSEIIHYSLHVCWREVKNSLFPSDTLIYGISRDGSKNYNIRTWEHMTRGQFRLWARATINVALVDNIKSLVCFQLYIIIETGNPVILWNTMSFNLAGSIQWHVKYQFSTLCILIESLIKRRASLTSLEWTISILLYSILIWLVIYHFCVVWSNFVFYF